MSVPKSSMKASRSILQAMKNDLHPRRRNGWSFFFWKLGRWKHCRAEFQSNSYKWGSRTQRRDRSPTKDQIKWVLLQNEWWLVQKPVFTNELSFWKLLWLLYNILHRAGIKLHARRKLTGSGRGVAVVQYFNCCAHFAAVPSLCAKIYTFHSLTLTSTELTWCAPEQRQNSTILHLGANKTDLNQPELQYKTQHCDQ